MIDVLLVYTDVYTDVLLVYTGVNTEVPAGPAHKAAGLCGGAVVAVMWWSSGGRDVVGR